MERTMTPAMLEAAYVRGHAMRTGVPELAPRWMQMPLDALTEAELAALHDAGRAAGLSLYHFKEKQALPRVKKALGYLRAVWPQSVLDVGSGRGAFLFPLLCALPDIRVMSADILAHRVEFLGDIARGGVTNLTAMKADICRSGLPDRAFDAVTLLEVLEHIPDVETAVREAVRLARRCVVVTVPSKPDDNPEHIHLLTRERLTALFESAGCTRLQFDGVPGHLFMAATIDDA